MNRHGTQLRKIDEEDQYALKYDVHFPLHEAAAAGDTAACEHLAKRKHVSSYNEEGKLALHCAAEGGHFSTVKLLLQHGADVNAHNKFTGDTCLHISCSNGSINLVEVLLKKGANAFEVNKKGVTPVHLAAEHGYKEILVTLVAAGATVTCQDKNGEYPLHYAARSDQPEVLETLAKLGTNLDAMNKATETALHVAAVHGSVSSIKKLYQLGANIDCIDKAGETPLHFASRVEHLGSIEALAEVGADLNHRNNAKECPIHMAARLDKWQSVRHLISAGVDIATPFRKGSQAVHIAAQHGNTDVIRVLKMEHADLNAEDKSGNRPVHYAVKADQVEAVKLLVELGANINAPGKRKETALHVVVKQKKVQLVQLLGSLGADCNLENETALVPLYYAAVNEDLPTAKCLIRFGAKLNKLNSEGQGLVHIMVEEEQLEGLTVMLTLHANFALTDKTGRTCIHMASEDRQVRVLKHLQDIGVDLTAPNRYGLSALHDAVMEGRGEEIDMLNNIGVDLNCKSKNFERNDDTPSLCKSAWPPGDVDLEDYWKIKIGMTPAHLALCYQREDVLSHLVTCGADINQGNDSGETVFHIAALYSMTDWLPKLLSLGANRNCQDKLGRTALHYAAHTGDISCLRLLLKYGALATETDNDGKQALHYAAEAGHFLLLSEITGRGQGVDVNFADNNGGTALHYACRTGKIDTILELIQLQADVTARDNTGNTVVHQAAASGQQEVLAQLAALGCNMDVQNVDMKTPLHVAAEHGQGEAMEVLLMCGCDPEIRDKNGNLPSTFRLSPQLKHNVARRIKQSMENRASKHTSGEINYDCRVISSGNLTELRRLSARVQLDCSETLQPVIFLQRTPSDSAHMDITVNNLEEILSDVYELWVLNFETEGVLKIELPLDSYPGNFETFLKTTGDEEYPSYTTSEENGNPVFVGKMNITRGFKKTFAVLARPRIFEHKVGADGGVLMSEVDRALRVEVPSGTFDLVTNVGLQVLETSYIDKPTDVLLACDVLSITSSNRLLAKFNVQLPYHGVSQDADDIVVFIADTVADLENERRWRELDELVRIHNDCVTFETKHCGIYIPIVLPRHSLLTTEAAKRLAKEKIKGALRRESSVLFFYAFSPRNGYFLTIFECTTPGRFLRRKEFWENEGFYFHAQVKHSGHFFAKPNQVFSFDVTGNMLFVGGNSNKLKLTFNPRAYKFQSFYLTRKDKAQPQTGELQVFSVQRDNEAKTGGREVLLTTLPIDIPLRSPCVIA